MAVPIALYTSPCTSVCSTPYPCQINAHGTYDFELNSRSSSTGTSSASNSQKTTLGGLSCLFSAPSVKQASFSGDREDLGSVWRDKGENLKEFSCSFRFSPTNYLCGGTMKRDQSPVSVLQCPVSYSSSSPIRVARDWVSGDASGSLRGEVNGLFKGIVRNALGSSAFYDSTSVDVDRDGLDTVVGASSGLDELTFNMDDGSVEANHAPYAEELLASAKLRHKIFSEDLVVKAFYEAERAHRGQVRASGDPYLQHCVETAVLLATIGASSTVVAAGLLHDTIDDSFLNYDYIHNVFGAEVADLVRGVSKLSQLSKLARQNNTASKTVEADRLHTMFLAMTDARAVLIKLADRLHNMMTLDALPLVKQQRFAKETLEIFSPIANRLGIFSWKEKLENFCFKYLYSDQHRYMSSKLVETFDEEMINSASEKLERAFKAEAISYHLLSGRHKSLYSIYCKMAKKKLRMDEIHDIHGLRVIVENEEDCYKALRVVQQLWSEVPGKFKDYISRPKYNGYQSLHTVVIGEGGVPLEVQIRTKEMHLQAEIGIAAHWRYKEDDSKHSSFVLKMVEWARWVITWHCEALKKNRSLIECVDSVKPPCSFSSLVEDSPFSYKSDHGQDGPVFVILIDNDKMSVQEFPANSTVNDLLERMGSQSPRLTFYGSPVIEELRARVNHEPIDDTKFKVKMGDVVEVTATVPDKSLTECREEIQRIYNRGSTAASSTSATATGMTACRS